MTAAGFVITIFIAGLLIGSLMFAGGKKRDTPEQYKRKQEEAWKRAKRKQEIDKKWKDEEFGNY